MLLWKLYAHGKFNRFEKYQDKIQTTVLIKKYIKKSKNWKGCGRE